LSIGQHDWVAPEGRFGAFHHAQARGPFVTATRPFMTIYFIFK
jgi:hypothetical protein